MENPMTTHNKTKKEAVPPVKQEERSSLKGTFAAVMILGGFLLLTWIGIFILFMLRS